MDRTDISFSVPQIKLIGIGKERCQITVVYDILCKLEKWNTLLGNNPKTPKSPGGKMELREILPDIIKEMSIIIAVRKVYLGKPF